MTCLVVVEGESDRGFVKGLAERLGLKVEVLKMRGNRPDKAVRLVKAALEAQNYSKVIVLKDQHESREEAVREKLQKIKNGVRDKRVHAIMVKRAVEAWMLAGMGERSAESIEKPDDYLDTVLKQRGKGSYIKSFEKARQLVEEIDLQVAQKLSHTLREFIDRLRDPSNSLALSLTSIAM